MEGTPFVGTVPEQSFICIIKRKYVSIQQLSCFAWRTSSDNTALPGGGSEKRLQIANLATIAK